MARRREMTSREGYTYLRGLCALLVLTEMGNAKASIGGTGNGSAPTLLFYTDPIRGVGRIP